MAFPDDQIEELKALYGSVQRAVEGGVEFFLLPSLALPDGCRPDKVDALLCPTPRDGYPSRLYLAAHAQGKIALNWNSQIRILERNWFAFSWKINAPGELRLAQMVQTHLRGLR